MNGVSPRVVALDGPAGSGKSTVARAVASALGWRYVDTGATYRAATLAVLQAGLDPQTAPAPAVVAVVEALFSRHGLGLSVDPAAGGVTVDGVDVSTVIRGPAVTGAVSAVSALPDVRTRVVAFQQALIAEGPCVVEGRDIGTVVVPSAPVKIFLDAPAEIRAQRRASESEPGVAVHSVGPVLESVSDDLARRDRLDSTRAVSPLMPAGDALVVDTAGLSIEEVVRRVVALAVAAGLHEGVG